MQGFPFYAPSAGPFPRRAATLPLVAPLLLCLAVIGCGDFTLFGNDEVNQAPVADAGADNTAPLACGKDTVNLDGTGSSDPDGDSLSYQWEITSSPSGSTASVQDATESQAAFQPDQPGSYEIDLTVEDGRGGSNTASVTVTASSDPVVDAGDDQQVSFDETVLLDGGDSVNPEQDCTAEDLAYSWTLSEPDDEETDLGSNVQAEFVAEKEGAYTATLEVTNDSGTDSDTVNVVVGGATLETLEGGPYVFTVEEVTDTVFAGVVAGVLPPGTVLDDTVDIPSLDEVPQLDRTIPLSHAGGSFGEAVVDIDRLNPTDNFYTVTGTASGAAIAFGVQCEIQADSDGEITPTSTNTVSVALTISNPVVTGDPLCSLADTSGRIELTLSGELEQ